MKNEDVDEDVDEKKSHLGGIPALFYGECRASRLYQPSKMNSF